MSEKKAKQKRKDANATPVATELNPLDPKSPVIPDYPLPLHEKAYDLLELAGLNDKKDRLNVRVWNAGAQIMAFADRLRKEREEWVKHVEEVKRKKNDSDGS